MSGGLPSYFVLQYADQRPGMSSYYPGHLLYVHEGREQGCLHFLSGQQAISPYCKHELVPAQDEANKGLYHIRCCYNNRYWTLIEDWDSGITATAEFPNEERSTVLCTLFDLKTVGGDRSKIRVLHVGSNTYASGTPGKRSPMCASTEPGNANDIHNTFSIIDWDSFVILPERVVFKGDNDRYLSLRYLDGGYPYLTFDSTEVDLPTLPNRVFYTPDGNIRIMSESNSKFWNLNPNWIWAESSEETYGDIYNSSNSLFRVVKGRGDNEVALRNVANNHFCQRLTADRKTDCLNASASTMSKETILKVEEPVISRTISNFDFRLKEARYYDEKVISHYKKTHVNGSSLNQQTSAAESYTTDITTTWKTNISVKMGIKFTASVGVEATGKASLEVTSETVMGYEYGVATKRVITRNVGESVTVPPKTKMTISVMATQAKYDVPYSYTQKDTLTNGETVTYQKDDGVYSGSNSYNFKVELKEEPL